MARLTCKKCGTLMEVVKMGTDTAHVACPRCNPKAFSKGQ